LVVRHLEAGTLTVRVEADAGKHCGEHMDPGAIYPVPALYAPGDAHASPCTDCEPTAGVSACSWPPTSITNFRRRDCDLLGD
jgi:hypothetical protein